MRLTITPSGPGAQAFLLGDDAGPRVLGLANYSEGCAGGIDEFLPGQERLLRVKPKINAPYQSVFAAYNLLNSISFAVKRTFATAELATAFRDTHADFVPVSGEICKTEKSATGTSTRYLPNALCKLCQCEKNLGVTIWFKYIFVSGNAWRSTP